MWLESLSKCSTRSKLIFLRVGTGMSGFVIPFVKEWGLQKISLQSDAPRLGRCSIHLIGPPLYFVKPRMPLSMTSRSRRFDFHFLRTLTFWVLQAGNVFKGLGFFIPSTYLPTSIKSMGLSSVSATLTVPLVNTTSDFGAVTMGSLSDKIHVTSVNLISTVVSTMPSSSSGVLLFHCRFCACLACFIGSLQAAFPLHGLG